MEIAKPGIQFSRLRNAALRDLRAARDGVWCFFIILLILLILSGLRGVEKIFHQHAHEKFDEVDHFVCCCCCCPQLVGGSYFYLLEPPPCFFKATPMSCLPWEIPRGTLWHWSKNRVFHSFEFFDGKPVALLDHQRPGISAGVAGVFCGIFSRNEVFFQIGRDGDGVANEARFLDPCGFVAFTSSVITCSHTHT